MSVSFGKEGNSLIDKEQLTPHVARTQPMAPQAPKRAKAAAAVCVSLSQGVCDRMILDVKKVWLASLTPEAVSRMRERDVRAIPPHLVHALSQIQALPTPLFALLTPEQVQNLSMRQLRGLNPQAIAAIIDHLSPLQRNLLQPSPKL